MASTKKLLHLAANVARLKLDGRCFCLGAVAIRSDDVMVFAYNGAPKEPCQQHHCEARLARKLDKGATVYLARTTSDGRWAMSKPCLICQMLMRKKGVYKVYYTIGPNQWETMLL